MVKMSYHPLQKPIYTSSIIFSVTISPYYDAEGVINRLLNIKD